jgi:hypothetical protein
VVLAAQRGWLRLWTKNFTRGITGHRFARDQVVWSIGRHDVLQRNLRRFGLSRQLFTRGTVLHRPNLLGTLALKGRPGVLLLEVFVEALRASSISACRTPTNPLDPGRFDY